MVCCGRARTCAYLCVQRDGDTAAQVWIATGKVTTYLSTVVQLDVAAETKVATLFRGNSLGTKCMDQFMKIVAMYGDL